MFQIKRLEVRNFKSFDHLEIELGKFNLLIGANASGKSNFVQILRFLKDITIYSLTDAISLSGGEYFLNRNIGRSEDFFLKIILGGHKVPAIILEQLIKPFKGEENGEAEIIYEFGLRFIDEGDEFEITRE
ncbi:MAG: AAA family ATPase, partial [bacterium]